MQTELADFIKDTPEGREADAILRKCVHCGFCTATCPTYQLLGDELDGPRGRIYLIKGMLEGAAVTAQDAAAPGPLPHLPRLRDHLPVRRAVRTPGRHRPQARGGARAAAAARSGCCGGSCARCCRAARCSASLLRLGRWLRPVLPFALQGKIPATVPAAGAWPRRAACAQDAGARRLRAAGARRRTSTRRARACSTDSAFR